MEGSSGFGHAKVSWAQVCKTTEEGGLGIRSVLLMNQALMFEAGLAHLCKRILGQYGLLGCLDIDCAIRRSGHLMLPRHLGCGRRLLKSAHFLKMVWCIRLAMEALFGGAETGGSFSLAASGLGTRCLMG
ncbi:UNVERIFIED_CONTAM: hypothetical protein Sradi_3618300 [Sesamum radiatum]|uniref:Uncharacterized protein n=1 Tax=Sesamum radiatum TaxID=300843 RepID=A0AAW2QHG3_SESRA